MSDESQHHADDVAMDPEPVVDGAPVADAVPVTAEPASGAQPATAGKAPAEPIADTTAPPPGDAADLLALIDRLSGLLERSDLTELEVEAGGTGLILRKPAALAPTLVMAASAAPAASPTPAVTGGPSQAGRQAPSAPEKPSVRAPLTGIWYASPAPGSPAYVRVGGEVAVGQTIGLIEAMKLFNEIKSDLAGRVVRVAAESGQLVKAKQPLIEVEPL
jgi:acetyl-CoA carboxylase biotin carboxyl carrier protein